MASPSAAAPAAAPFSPRSRAWLHRAIALILIRKSERLVPAEIRFLRKHLGWSGADFARKFHCSPSQVSRWESEANPAPMSNAYELLLRTLVAQGEKIEDYQQHMEEIATVAEARPACWRWFWRRMDGGGRRELEVHLYLN